MSSTSVLLPPMTGLPLLLLREVVAYAPPELIAQRFVDLLLALLS